MPMKIARPPPCSIPAVRAPAISGPDSRVSMPRRIVGGPVSFNRCASASPSANIVEASNGYWWAFPRMPSVPNRVLISYLFLLGHGLFLGCGVGGVGDAYRSDRADLRIDGNGRLRRQRLDDADQRGVGDDRHVLHERLGAAGHDNPFGGHFRDVPDL